MLLLATVATAIGPTIPACAAATSASVTLDLTVTTADGRPAPNIEVDVRRENPEQPQPFPTIRPSVETPPVLGDADAAHDDDGGRAVPLLRGATTISTPFVDPAVHLTDRRGHVTIGDLVPGDVIIELRTANRLLVRETDALDQPVVSRTTALPKMREVVLTVNDATGAPVGGARVVTAAAPVGWDHAMEGVTAQNGILTAALPAIPLTVFAGVEGRWGQVNLPASATAATVTLTVPAMVQVSGRDAAGNPVKGFTAAAELHVHPAWALETLTRSDNGTGAVMVPRGLAGAELRVVGEVPAERRDEFAELPHVDLDPDATAAQLTFVARPAAQRPGSVIIRVKTEPNLVPELAVVLAQTATGFYGRTVELQDGGFRLDRIPSGLASIVVRLPRQNLIWRGEVDIAGGETHEVSATLAPAARLTLALDFDREVEPATWVVEATNESSSVPSLPLDRPRPAFAGETLRIDALPPGPLKFLLVDRDQRAMVIRYTLAPGEDRKVKLAFTPLPNRVVLDGATLGPAATIRLSGGTSIPIERGVSLDADGTATLESLPPGHYRAVAPTGEAVFDVSETGAMRVIIEPRR